MTTPSIQNKLKSYSALAGSIALISTQADAQIIYTDINPDSTTNIVGNLYNLDLDNGGVFDFIFRLNAGTSSSSTSQLVAVSPTGSNGIAGDTIGAYVYPTAFNIGDTIKSTLQFNFTSSQSMASYFGSGNSYGNFIGQSDKYIGLQFNIGLTLHYGWARFDVDATASQFTIKDYAYNAIPDAYILAGEMPLGINDNPLTNSTSIYSSEKNIIIKSLTGKAIQADVKITNAIGQEIFHSSLSDIETVIDLNKEMVGIYFVTIAHAGIVYTKKVHIQ